VIIGAGAYARPDGAVILSLAARIAEAAANGADEGWSVFNVLHTAAGRVAGLDVGFVPGEGGRASAEIIAGAGSGDLDVVWLLGFDEIDVGGLGEAFVIYQGTHGDAGAHRADVILPAAAYTEKSATYVNTEGRAQISSRAVFPPGAAKEDWTIARALSALLGRTLPFDTLSELRAQMYKAAPVLARLETPHNGESEGAALAKLAETGGMADATSFQSVIADFYLTNPIARASAVMAELSALNKAAGGQGGLAAAE
jgi:NADH-quinone oxidoreductase subunit G